MKKPKPNDLKRSHICLTETLERKLRVQAAERGISFPERVRQILEAAVKQTTGRIVGE